MHIFLQPTNRLILLENSLENITLKIRLLYVKYFYFILFFWQFT